jgi:IPT/TIG domain
MSNTDQGGSMEGPRSPTAPVSDPASATNIHAFGIGFLIFAIFIFYALVTTWPVLEQGGASHAPAFKPFRFFGLGPYNWAPDLRMLLTVIIAGTIGSLIHTLTSFGDYVGNRRLGTSWMWWFVLRTPIGIALAIVSYLILRGGLIVPTLQVTKDTDLQGATLLLNPYGIAAFAALAGMFSRQATDKLREVFETLFTAQKAVPRSEPLRGRPAVEVDPARLTRGKPQVLTVTGSGFDRDIKATLNGEPRPVQWISGTELKITAAAADVATVGKLDLTLKNPNNDTFKAVIDVVE